MKNKEVTVEAVLFKVGIIGLAVLVALMLADRFFPMQMGRIKLPCMFNVITGYYCPGCGGTRAFKALLGGHLIKSFTYNPIVLYGMGLYVWFMGSHILERVTKGKIKGLKYRHIYLWLMFVILILNFCVRNHLLFHYGITLG